MSIENVIKEGLADIAAAIRENTQLVKTGLTAPVVEEKKVKPPKKTAKKKDPAPEPPKEEKVEETPVVEEEEEEEKVEETPAADTGIDRDAALLEITEYVKARITDPEGDSAKVKKDFASLREQFKVAKVSELPDEKLAEFFEATKTALPE